MLYYKNFFGVNISLIDCLPIIVSPIISAQPESFVTTERTVARIQCTAHGNPLPAVTWELNNETLGFINHEIMEVVSNLTVTSTVIIQAPTSINIGEYRCRAESSVATTVSRSVLFKISSKEERERGREGGRHCEASVYGTELL